MEVSFSAARMRTSFSRALSSFRVMLAFTAAIFVVMSQPHVRHISVCCTILYAALVRVQCGFAKSRNFITFSCCRRLPLLRSQRARDILLRELDHIREGEKFRLMEVKRQPQDPGYKANL